MRASDRSCLFFLAVAFAGCEKSPDFHLLGHFRGSGLCFVSSCLKVTPMTAQVNGEFMLMVWDIFGVYGLWRDFGLLGFFGLSVFLEHVTSVVTIGLLVCPEAKCDLSSSVAL